LQWDLIDFPGSGVPGVSEEPGGSGERGGVGDVEEGQWGGQPWCAYVPFTQLVLGHIYFLLNSFYVPVPSLILHISPNSLCNLYIMNWD